MRRTPKTIRRLSPAGRQLARAGNSADQLSRQLHRLAPLVSSMERELEGARRWFDHYQEGPS